MSALNQMGIDTTRGFLQSIAGQDARLSVQDLDLSLARTGLKFGLAANFLFVDTISYTLTLPPSRTPGLGTGVAFFTRSNIADDPVRLVPGWSYDITATNDIFIWNTAQPGKMVRVYYSVGPVVAPFQANTQVSVQGGDVVSSPDISALAATATQLIATNFNRTELVIQNPITNAREIRVGDAGVGVSEGALIFPGESLRLNTVDEVYAYSPHTSAMPITTLEIE